MPWRYKVMARCWWRVCLQSDGKVLVAGMFTSVNGTARNRIARLHADGTLDTSFDPGSGADNAIYTLALQSDGKVVIGGGFTSYNGTGRSAIARLNMNGTLDTTFNTGSGATGGVVYTLAIQGDGKVIIGGYFTVYNGVARNYIARLNTNGLLDTGFNPGSGATGGGVVSLAVQSDGKIVIWYRKATNCPHQYQRANLNHRRCHDHYILCGSKCVHTGNGIRGFYHRQ